jgi:hypothetical protein
MSRTCSTHVKVKHACKILVGKHEWESPFGRSRCSWEDNIKTDFNYMLREGVDWIQLAQCNVQW